MVSTVKGILSLVLLATVLLLAQLPLMLLALLKLLSFNRVLRHICTRAVISLCEGVVLILRGIYFTIHSPDWEAGELHGLSKNQSYLIISNHQTWNDIPVLMFLLEGRTAFFRFFIKRELIGLPFIGMAAWAMDFPFMKRYTREQLIANPNLHGRDMISVGNFCEKLDHDEPVCVINYLEGTRFSQDKKARQHSPYRYLLKPRYAGAARVVNSLGKRMLLLDVTLVYLEGSRGFWAFLCGNTGKVKANIVIREIPRQLAQGDYDESQERQTQFKSWIDGLWQNKDQLIADYLQGKAPGH